MRVDLPVMRITDALDLIMIQMPEQPPDVTCTSTSLEQQFLTESTNTGSRSEPAQDRVEITHQVEPL